VLSSEMEDVKRPIRFAAVRDRRPGEDSGVQQQARRKYFSLWHKDEGKQRFTAGLVAVSRASERASDIVDSS
jgi:hypothetical protein